MLPLYCEHFGLTREPFSVTPDPSFLYLSASHNEALAQLVYGIKARRGFVVLTGEVGTGKTTLIQGLLERINDGHTHSALIFNLIGSPKDFLRCFCEEFALAASGETQMDVQDYLALINRFLLERYRQGDNVVLIIDEAQNLSVDVLERVRLLSNFETKQEKLLQILLVGQPELGARLNQPELRQLKQRVGLRHHLSPLNLVECKDYITKRLEFSGTRVPLFSDTAIDTVHSYSTGIPRLVNILCDNGLLSAYALRKERVEAGMIEEIARELEITASPQAAATRPESNAIAFSAPRFDKFSLPDPPAVEGAACLDTKPLHPKPVLGGGPILGPGSGSAHTSPDFQIGLQNGSAKKNERRSEVVPIRFFQSMIRTLAEGLGPMATIIVNDHIAALDERKEAFPKDRIGQLIDEISLEIPNETMKGHFQQLISRELHTMFAGENNT